VATSGAQPGNQNARNAKRWQQAIRRALARKSGESVDKGLDELADIVVELAFSKERWAIEEVGNREDGKPAQVVAGDDDLPALKMEGILKLVKP
jgi:hypothetical protein